MATKLGRSEFPAKHSRDDFECFGPVVTKDADFSGSKLADFGCFKQDAGGVDSNKYYHIAVAKSKLDGKFYMYVEYGRTKDGQSSSPQFQFTLCSSEDEAQKEFVKQCAEKNTKRGVWEKVGSKDRFVAKTKKDGTTEDLYVVRYMISRSVGLPSAKNICNADGLPVAPTANVATKKKVTSNYDLPTRKLFKDLLGGTISYTRSIMVGNTIPAQSSINEAREILDDALDQVVKVGTKVEKQVADPTLRKLTYNLYGIVPKSKAQGVSESEWILSQENIGRWQSDLDAFETALKSANVETVDDNNDDVMQGIPARIEHVDQNTELGKWLVNWWKTCTRDKHGHKSLQVHNIWRVERNNDYDAFQKVVSAIADSMPSKWNNERPMFYEKQKERVDLSVAERKLYDKSNTALLFHASRSVNVPGIIRENFRFPSELRKTGVVINGAQFGGGIYHADDWGKSANYCSVGSGRSMYVGSSGHVASRKSFMFAVDTICGVPFLAPDAYGYTDSPSGYHSVFGKACFCSSWGVSRGLQNNEWVVYRKGRNCLRYLAEVSWY